MGKGRLFATVIVLLAVLMGILVLVMPPEKIMYLVNVSRFFEVMIPILGVGALLKYICCCHSHHGDDKGCGK